MNTTDLLIEMNRHYESCAETIRTLKLFIADAEQKHESSIPISTLKMVLGLIEEGTT